MVKWGINILLRLLIAVLATIIGGVCHARNEFPCYSIVDSISLRYDGNLLECADDATSSPVFSGATDFRDGADKETEYAYDANGNLTRDLNRDIRRISYDGNNMPVTATFGERKSCRFTYDASGRKLRAEYIVPQKQLKDTGISSGTTSRPPRQDRYRTTTIDYCSGNVYLDGKLLRTLLPTGYMENDSLYFFVKDFQGNVRLVVREDGEVVESNECYPYGALFDASRSVQPYKYGGQTLARRSGRCNVGRMPVATAKTTFGNEFDRTHGLDWYDSQASHYDPTVLRTTT